MLLSRPKRAATISALIIVYGAFLLRFYRLATVPFGWHPDEATKALLARDVLAGKFHPVFFSAFTGREALYVYLEALTFTLFGERIFAARLLSAFTGILTVALTYAVAKCFFSRRVGLFAAAFLALSLWHLIASRNGYRAVIQPLVQLPVLLLFFHGWRTKKSSTMRYFVAGGVWLGLTQYTYTAARFFPIVVIGIVLLATLTIYQRVWQRRAGLVIAALATAVVFLPLALHFWQHPLDFYGRAAQISVFSPQWSGGNPWLRLWQSLKETARMFTVWGDINYRFNVAGKPVFGLLDGALFYVGLALCIWRVWRTRHFERLAYATTLLWTAVMLLPMILSAESLPYYQRAIGALPAIYFLPAIATDAAVMLFQGFVGKSTTQPRSRHKGVTWFIVGAPVVLFLGWLAIRVYHDYFIEWHLAHRNDDDRRVAMVYVADYLTQHNAPSDLYISTQYVQHPTLALLAPEYYDRVRWFDATQSLPLPPPDDEARYIVLLENAPQSLLLEKVPHLQKTYTGVDRFDRGVFDVYEWTSNEWPKPVHDETATWSWEVTFQPGDPNNMRHALALPAFFQDIVAFEGYDSSGGTFQPGSTVPLVLYWQLLKQPERQYTFFAHLLDANGQVIAAYDANFYPTNFWLEEGGELLLNYFPLAIPPNAAPGVYQVEIGVYHQPSGERLSVIDQGEAVADRLLLQPINVQP